MNAENALSLLKLAQETSRARRAQLSALTATLNRLDCGVGTTLQHPGSATGATIESRTFSALALYLGQLGARIEKMIASEIDAIARQVRTLIDLPDQTQWDYRCASCFGSLAALNRAGTLQAKVFELASNALQKASVLLMARASDRALPVSDAGHQVSKGGRHNRSQARLANENEYFARILIDLAPPQLERMKEAIAMARQLSANCLQRALQADGENNQTLSAICSTAQELTFATLLANACAFAGEIAGGGAFIDDPAGVLIDPVQDNARLMAAGQLSGLISDAIKADNPWVAISLN